MRTVPRTPVLASLLVALALAQQPAFDVASVKVIDPATRPAFGHSGGPGTADPGRIHYCCDAMITLLTRAYGIQSDRVSGPDWLADFGGPNRYTIDATMPPDTTKAQFQSMLQSLLVERFHLKVHHETRNFPGYDLVVAKDGPKLKELAPIPKAADTPPQTPALKNGEIVFPPGPRMMSWGGSGGMRIEAQEKSIGDLASALGSMITQAQGANLMDFSIPKARVTDKTGLIGRYNFTLEFAGDPASDLPTVFVAIEKQLGLKLEKTKDIPLDVIVVDHVDKTPTGN
jgi:uncharacterized protein (TIGR03435 family)